MVKSASFQSGKMMMRIKRRLSLFPIIFKFKQYGVWWYRIGHCCNMDFYSLKVWLLIQFAFRDKVYWTCPQCHKQHCIRLSYHIEEVWDKELRERNKLIK